MKFREHGEVEGLILEANSSDELCAILTAFGDTHDIIDLQYSTTTQENGSIHYSVFILASI